MPLRPPDLLISEVVEGSSNNKAVEIYNGTSAAIDLAAGGYTLAYYFNGSSSAGTTIPLTGSVASGDVYVVAQSLASAAVLAAADQTSSASWYNGDDAIVLTKAGVGARRRRAGRLRPRHRVGHGSRLDGRQHAAPSGRRVRGGPRRHRRVRSLDRVGRLRDRRLRRPRCAHGRMRRGRAACPEDRHQRVLRLDRRGRRRVRRAARDAGHGRLGLLAPLGRGRPAASRPGYGRRRDCGAGSGCLGPRTRVPCRTTRSRTAR